MKLIRRRTFNRMKRRLARLYGPERAGELGDRLYMLFGRYGVSPQNGPAPASPNAACWSEKDAVLIAYGDMVRRPGVSPMRALKEFCDRRLRGAISTVHVLPFFPSSSDGGFSVIDYRRVDPALGRWEDLEWLARDYGLMVDLVLNHCSRRSAWFRDYVNGIAPCHAYFQEGDPGVDHSGVVRPRSTPLFTEVETARGIRQVWNTFSADQVDLNWRSPDVLFEFLDLLLGYVARGVRIVRLDAVAFLWKESGTTCLHLPETHEVVKLMRDVLRTVAPHVILLTETNVPHAENISYFGNGDEAQMVYQFALPPLLLHGLLRNDSSHLQTWARALDDPPRGTTFLNFTASHDGIGVRPLEGMVAGGELDWLLDEVRSRGGLVSMRAMPDGSAQPYELNITYRDALSVRGDEKAGLQRFLCSQCLMMSLRGMPALYFQSVVGARNWTAGPEREGGEKRDINRERWEWNDLEAKLDDPDRDHAWILNVFSSMLRSRAQCPAFHPDARQEVLRTGGEVFAMVRRSLCGQHAVLCLFNFTGRPVTLDGGFVRSALGPTASYRNLLNGGILSFTPEDTPRLGPYEGAWIVAR